MSMMRRLAVVAACAGMATAAGCSLSGSSGSPATSGSDGAVVFVAPGPSHGLGVDNTDVYAVASAGGPPRDLTRSAGAEQSAAWTPNGSRMVFTRQYTTGRENGQVTYHVGIFTMAVGGAAHLIRRCTATCDARDFAWSPDGRQIAFVSNVPSHLTGFAGEVIVMNADGSDPRVVCDESRCGQGLEAPEWSPDGSRVVFSNEGVIGFSSIGILPSGIWIANVDGSGVRKLTQPRCRPGHAPLVGCFYDSAPAWSPDGSTIAFSRLDQRFRPGAQTPPVTQLEVMHADGSGLRPIASCMGDRCSQVMAPVWSPRGARIAFARDDYEDPAIVLVNLARRSVTIRACAGSRCVTPADLVWSPNGLNLAFLDSTNPSAAFVMGTNGRHMHRIAPNVDCCLAWLSGVAMPAPAAGHHGHQSTVSPKLGGTITFSSDLSSPGNDSVEDPYALDLQTGRVSRLTPSSRHPQVSAGRPVVRSQALPDGSDALFIDGRRITDLPGSQSSPVVSPDGRHVAFVWDTDAGSGLYLIDVNGTGLRRVSSDPIGAGAPAWSPDGRYLAFATTYTYARGTISAVAVATGRVTTLATINGDTLGLRWASR
jgi:Tol biopolymer transport system component